MESAGIALLLFVAVAGVAVIPFGIAGTFVIFADALVYGLITRFDTLTLPFIGLLLLLALAVEGMEEIFTAVLARRFGGSRWAMLGAIAGSFTGAVIGTSLAPVAGTLLGGFAGAFTGACMAELLKTSDLRQGVRVGTGALLGAMGGKMTKLIVAVIMTVLIAVRVL